MQGRRCAFWQKFFKFGALELLTTVLPWGPGAEFANFWCVPAPTSTNNTLWYAVDNTLIVFDEQ